MLSISPNRPRRRSLRSLTCALALLGLGLAVAPGALGQAAARPGMGPEAVLADTTVSSTTAPTEPGGGLQASIASATLQQCLTAVTQSGRSATFAAEIDAVPGSARMLIRVDVQEESPGETMFRTITAPGLGGWRSSDPGVKTYRYLKQVTNLSAPAAYRAAVHFRWLSAKGRLIRVAERHTPRCQQPAPPPLPSSPTISSSDSAVAGALLRDRRSIARMDRL